MAASLEKQKEAESKWKKYVEEHKTSGLSANEYCRRKGLEPKYFSLWRRRFRDRAVRSEKFIRITPQQESEIIKGEDPLSGDAYIFLNRSCQMIKCLSWDDDGYVIWYKRLERGKFLMPDGTHILINRTEWMHMLEGIEAKIVSRQPRYNLSEKR